MAGPSLEHLPANAAGAVGMEVDVDLHAAVSAEVHAQAMRDAERLYLFLIGPAGICHDVLMAHGQNIIVQRLDAVERMVGFVIPEARSGLKMAIAQAMAARIDQLAFWLSTARLQ